MDTIIMLLALTALLATGRSRGVVSTVCHYKRNSLHNRHDDDNDAPSLNSWSRTPVRVCGGAPGVDKV
uniref:Putative secreted protein n=1 Tax=Anopheles darlingi TaxID=43151 RepID=A0A2M4DFY1_ANODA